jgi:hypothetical protein
MRGGLMQLVAYGAQDIYLTGNTSNTSNTVIQQTATEEPQTIPEEPEEPESSEAPLTVPLSFWFNQNSNSAIPLVALPLVALPFAQQNIDLGIADYESLDYETPHYETPHYNNNNDYDNYYDHDYDNILYLTEEIIEIDRYEECIISLEQIQNNENIAKCSQCRKIAKYTIMQQWFNENASCPHCRGEYPEVNFLCGKGNFVKRSHSTNNFQEEEQDLDNQPNKKVKL